MQSPADILAEESRSARGRIEYPDVPGQAVHAAFIEHMQSGFGTLKAVQHSARLSKTPAHWSRPAMPLGSHSAQWPGRS